ncbi:MAG TPA: Rrf2 family transcriptional regulator [Ktedonobacteraceae bacterium]|nr:Rrf2 family transcriptional regulator [Ktedonobacteraceae bacterium]
MILQASTKGEYGVRIMVDLARHYGERPRSLTDISQVETLPLAYLEQLVKLLREAVPPLVTSTRGAHGGYALSRGPEDITMGEIVRVLEGPISPMICAPEGEMTQICNFLDGCGTKYLWAKLRDVVAQTLDAMTLADLVKNSPVAERGVEGAINRASTRFIALSDIRVVSDMGFGLPELSTNNGEPQVRSLL